MNSKTLINIDKDTSYYGKDQAVYSKLDQYYPTFDVSLNSGDIIYVEGTSVAVQISISNIRCGGVKVPADNITINGSCVEGDVITETISMSKRYDIEVTYKGRTTIKTRTIYIIKPVTVAFSTDTGTVIPTLTGTVLKPVVSEVQKHTFEASRDSYLWIKIPKYTVNVDSVMVAGLLNPLAGGIVISDGVFDYWRSTDILNEGEWQLIIKFTVPDKAFALSVLTTKPATEGGSDTSILSTSDGLNLKCIQQ